MCTVCAVLLVLLAVQRDIIKDATEGNEGAGITASSVVIESSIYTDEVSLVHAAISEYLRSDASVTAKSVYKKYEGYNYPLNIAVPVHYRYDIDGLPVNASVTHLRLAVSRNADFSAAKEYDLDPDGTSVALYHLETGRTYYYRLTLAVSIGEGTTTLNTTGEFSTAISPRILTIENIPNVRDIGGWMTDSGVRISQGLLYRGSELDGAVAASYRLTDAGRDVLLTDLGIRFDMDLRSESVNPVPTDALGRFVTHRYYGISMYSGIFEDGETEKLRAIFSDLADKQNYPMYMHCTYGRDRTGTVCYLLEALLGVSEEDLRREYELSAFTDSYVDSENFAVFLADLRRMEGNTMKDKVEGYLLSIGVTAEEIASIRAIFLGTES